jgi:hypothetical protein
VQYSRQELRKELVGYLKAKIYLDQIGLDEGLKLEVK